jgi:integral membrane sensor domain MASE1
VLFVALATMGGGLADGFETLLSDHEHASERVASMAIAIPVALFLIGLVILMLVNGDRVSSVRTAPKLGGATVVLVAGATTSPVVTTVVAAVVLVVLVTWMVLAEPDAAEAPPV